MRWYYVLVSTVRNPPTIHNGDQNGLEKRIEGREQGHTELNRAPTGEQRNLGVFLSFDQERIVDNSGPLQSQVKRGTVMLVVQGQVVDNCGISNMWSSSGVMWWNVPQDKVSVAIEERSAKLFSE